MLGLSPRLVPDDYYFARMNWTEEALENVPVRNGFRMRGESMTRLEVFSDAAFAFAVTTLVVSVGSIPGDLDELVEALKKVPAFALSFAQITAFWIAHRGWSRRFGLEDSRTTLLTLFMIFTILVYVYPLRLIFSTFMAWVTGGWLPWEYEPTSAWEVQGLFGIYGIGFAMLAGTLAALFWMGLVKREELKLDTYEIIRTKESVVIWSIQATVGLFSALWALLLPSWLGVYAGFLFFILPIAMPICGVRFGKLAKRELERRQGAANDGNEPNDEDG